MKKKLEVTTRCSNKEALDMYFAPTYNKIVGKIHLKISKFIYI